MLHPRPLVDSAAPASFPPASVHLAAPDIDVQLARLLAKVQSFSGGNQFSVEQLRAQADLAERRLQEMHCGEPLRVGVTARVVCVGSCDNDLQCPEHTKVRMLRKEDGWHLTALWRETLSRGEPLFGLIFPD